VEHPAKGPWLLPVRGTAGFNEDGLRRRFSARPASASPWQVKGRSSISFGKRTEFDVQDIDD
jgi:lipopolysaccharide/colanic/teichoic acid biosynthesis glycosyltransferase